MDGGGALPDTGWALAFSVLFPFSFAEGFLVSGAFLFAAPAAVMLSAGVGSSSVRVDALGTETVPDASPRAGGGGGVGTLDSPELELAPGASTNICATFSLPAFRTSSGAPLDCDEVSDGITSASSPACALRDISARDSASAF